MKNRQRSIHRKRSPQQRSSRKHHISQRSTTIGKRNQSFFDLSKTSQGNYNRLYSSYKGTINNIYINFARGRIRLSTSNLNIHRGLTSGFRLTTGRYIDDFDIRRNSRHQSGTRQSYRPWYRYHASFDPSGSNFHRNGGGGIYRLGRTLGVNSFNIRRTLLPSYP